MKASTVDLVSAARPRYEPRRLKMNQNKTKKQRRRKKEVIHKKSGLCVSFRFELPAANVVLPPNQSPERKPLIYRT